MTPPTFTDAHVELDAEGFLVHPDQWIPDMGPEIARSQSRSSASCSPRAPRSWPPRWGGISHEVACEELLRSSGTQFDPAVVEALLAEIESAGKARELTAAQDAAAHVRMLLGAVTARV